MTTAFCYETCHLVFVWSSEILSVYYKPSVNDIQCSRKNASQYWFEDVVLEETTNFLIDFAMKLRPYFWCCVR